MKEDKIEKVLLIGLDGATFDIINPLLAQGKLPNIARFLMEGAHSECASTIIPCSPVAWNTCITGKNPGKHGIFGFLELNPKDCSLRIVNGSFRRAKPLWSFFDKDKKAVVVNVPFTSSPDKINGIFMPGWDAPDTAKEIVCPKDILKQVNKRFGGFFKDYSIGSFFNYRDAALVLKKLNLMTDNRLRLVKFLMDSYPWDFYMAVFSLTDMVQHYFWHCMDSRHPRYKDKGAENYREAIYEAYEKIDGIVGVLTKGLDENTNIVFVSDHGMGPMCLEQSGDCFKLDIWLVENGFMQLKPKGYSAALWAFRNILRRYLPCAVKERLKAVFLFYREKFVFDLYFSDIYWKATKAYTFVMPYPVYEIWINLKGRERWGVVRPGKEYENLRDSLIEKLSQLEHPLTKKKLAKAVYRREELYSGSQVLRAPDIIIDWADDFFFSGVGASGAYKPSNFYDRRLTATHRENGIFIAKGRHIKRGVKLDGGVSLKDIAPTVLYLMGQKVPSGMDGKALKDIIREDFLKNNPVSYFDEADAPAEEKQSSYSNRQASIVEDRLRALGYI